MAVDQNSDVGTIDVCLVKNNSSSTEFEPLDNGEKQFTASLTDLVSGLDRASDPEDMPLLAGKWLAEATGSDHIGVAVLSATDEPLSFTLQRVDAFETESRQPVELSADAAESLSGLTLASGTLTAVEHLARDERVVDQVLEAAGIASAIVCPIVIQGKTTGTFGVYHSAP
ncbi:MAG: GAF domain-containing protein, partial [Pirellulaceae bacterium]|nr:GAF domain-containing protein [Pirellulaceae bacterium]